MGNRFILTEEEKKDIRKLYEDFTFKEIMLGEKLHKKFIDLGDMSKLTYDDIVEKVRRPDSIDTRSGLIIANWNTSKTEGVLFPNPYYSISILFNQKREFVRILSENFS